jgi:hypothetical protein
MSAHELADFIESAQEEAILAAEEDTLDQITEMPAVVTEPETPVVEDDVTPAEDEVLEATPPPSVAQEHPEGLFDQIGQWWSQKNSDYKTRFWVVVAVAFFAALALWGGGGLRATVLIAAIAAAIYFAPRVVGWFRKSAANAEFRMNSVDRSMVTAILFGLVGLLVALAFAPLYADWRWSGENPGWYVWALGASFVAVTFMVGGWLGSLNNDNHVVAETQAVTEPLADRVRAARTE